MNIWRYVDLCFFEIELKLSLSIFAMHYFHKIIVIFTFSNKIDVFKRRISFF